MIHHLWVTSCECTFLSKSSFFKFELGWCHYNLEEEEAVFNRNLILSGNVDFEFWRKSLECETTWHPRDYSKHMSRDDVINTSDADHMILVYNHMTNPSNFTMWKFLKFWSKISFWSPKITKKVDFFQYFGQNWFFCRIKVFLVIFRLIKHMLKHIF